LSSLLHFDGLHWILMAEWMVPMNTSGAQQHLFTSINIWPLAIGMQWIFITSHSIWWIPTTSCDFQPSINWFQWLTMTSCNFHPFPATSNLEMAQTSNNIHWSLWNSTYFQQHPTQKQHRLPTVSAGVFQIPPTSCHIQHENGTNFQWHPLEFAKFCSLPATSNTKMASTGAYWIPPTSCYIRHEKGRDFQWHPPVFIGSMYNRTLSISENVVA